MKIGFDLDGTIIDSAQSIRDALAEAIWLETKQRLSLESLLPGLALAQMLGDLGFQEEESDAISSAFKRIYDSGLCFTATPYEGVEEVLQALSAKHELYVVTNKRQVSAERILEYLGLAGNFILIRGQAEDVNHEKWRLLSGVKQDLGFRYGLYIGDTRDDVVAAEHAELTPIFCRWGYGKSLDGHWADCIQRPSDILDLVD